VPIGSKAIIQLIAECDPAKLFAFTWEDKGYAVYYITGKDGKTLGYDVTSGKWHRRQSFGLDRWRLNTLTKWNGTWYGGDYSNGKLYALTWGYAYEGCELMPRTFRTGVLHSTDNRIRVHGLRVLADTGRLESVIGTETAPRISGSLPDTNVGDVVSFQYTITPAYPGQVITLTLCRGAAYGPDDGSGRAGHRHGHRGGHVQLGHQSVQRVRNRPDPARWRVGGNTRPAAEPAPPADGDVRNAAQRRQRRVGALSAVGAVHRRLACVPCRA
jgi:hypothetical protein